MQALTRGRYVAQLAQDAEDVALAQGLRHLAFHASRGQAKWDARDADSFDAHARHLLVRLGPDGALVACCRLQVFQGAQIEDSYSAQFYDLHRLARFPGPMMEVGRFCLHPDCHDPDVLRLAWAALAQLVEAQGIGLLFGCSSFDGADAARHGAALWGLVARIGPEVWRPGIRAPEIVMLHDCAPPQGVPDRASAPPALLRTYLGMGGWVSDHAVLDRDLDTLHVMTGVEIDAIPPARARALRLIAGMDVG